MESKDSVAMPSPGPAGAISGAGSFSILPQRNGAAPLEMCPSPVSGTPSSCSGPGSLSALPQRNGGPPAEMCPTPFFGMMSSGVHTPSTARLDYSTPVSADLVVDVSSTPSRLSSPYACDMSTAIVPHSAGASISGVVNIGGNFAKRKRGRPRKYAPDGSMALALTLLAAAPSPFPPSQKRGRGRPPGSGKKQQLAALGGLMVDSAGAGFTPHAITVAAGEDVATKIMSFSQQGPRGICILSANGAISNVTLQQSATSGGTVTYEGRFEILSLSGSFLLTESGGTRTRTGGLSVSLAGPDGRVVGGGVAGLLMAAGPVQVIVGSFISNTRKPQANAAKVDRLAGLSQISPSRIQTTGIPVVRSPVSEMPDIKPVVPESPPLNQFIRTVASSNAQPLQSQPIVIPLVWSASQVMPEARRNTGIDISLPGG